MWIWKGDLMSWKKILKDHPDSWVQARIDRKKSLAGNFPDLPELRNLRGLAKASAYIRVLHSQGLSAKETRAKLKEVGYDDISLYNQDLMWTEFPKVYEQIKYLTTEKHRFPQTNAEVEIDGKSIKGLLGTTMTSYDLLHNVKAGLFDEKIRAGSEMTITAFFARHGEHTVSLDLRKFK